MRSFTGRKGHLSLVALAVTLSATAAPAVAQDDGGVDEITVTGSRIMRSNEVMPNPVYGLDSEEIQATGQLDIINVVNKLPQLFSSQNGTQSTFFGADASGVNAAPGVDVLDLRGLGLSRTLTLVDGTRHVGGGVVGRSPFVHR